MRRTLSIVSWAALLASAATAQDPYYTVEWKAPRDGHYTAWWTKDGKRVSATPENPQGTPCVDTDVVKDQIVRFTITHTPGAINDHDGSFKAAEAPSSSGTASAYTVPDFAALLDPPGGSTAYFLLWDPAGSDIAVRVALEIWAPYLARHPMPEVGRIVLFQDGMSPELPGFFATYEESGEPFGGHLVLDEPMTLRVGELAGPAFLRGDANADGLVDISDPVFTLEYLFRGGATPRCLSALDANDSSEVDISDAIYSLGFLFTGGPPPPNCFPVAGPDPTPDGLGCASPP